jgi:hypothetical protein
MTKSELRVARKAARAAGQPLTGELALPSDRGAQPVEFTESHKGRRALYCWARRYDALNGAPESDYDR